MKNLETRQIVITALGIAVVFAATMLIKIPNPYQGYFNAGDGVIFIFATLLNPVLAFVVGGLGSGLADLAGGYVWYFFFTLVIKGLEGVIVSVLYHKYGSSRLWLATLIAAAWMVFGYYIAGGILLNSFATAALDIPGNIVQGLAGVAVCLLLEPLVRKAFSERHFA